MWTDIEQLMHVWSRKPPETAEVEPVADSSLLAKPKMIEVAAPYRNIDPAFMQENIAGIRFSPSFAPLSEDPSYDILRTVMDSDYDEDAEFLKPTKTEGWCFYRRENFGEITLLDNKCFLSCQFIREHEGVAAEKRLADPSYQDAFPMYFFWINDSEGEKTRIGVLEDFKDIGVLRTIMEQYFDMNDFPLQDMHETIAHRASL